MKNNKDDLPACVQNRHRKELKRKLDLGTITLADMSQPDRDLLHMEEDHKCLNYWTGEKKLACERDDAERIIFTDQRRRYLLLVLHNPEPSNPDDARLTLLGQILSEADSLPAVHRT